MAPFVKATDRVLDVGSADGPSAAWLRDRAAQVTAMDLDPRGLDEHGVVGSLTAIPFADETFDVVSAFDVVEHCADEGLALTEARRVLKPGGLFLVSVPAYEWAWTSFDVKNAHHRRYTRRRLRRSMELAGLDVVRITHGFTGVFPFFAADRLRTRVQERKAMLAPLAPGEVPPLPDLSPAVERTLKLASKLDTHLIGHRDLPFGSSVLAVARKSTEGAQ